MLIIIIIESESVQWLETELCELVCKHQLTLSARGHFVARSNAIQTHTHKYIYITYVFVFGSLNPQLSPEIAFVPAHPLELNMTTDCSI